MEHSSALDIARDLRMLVCLSFAYNSYLIQIFIKHKSSTTLLNFSTMKIFFNSLWKFLWSIRILKLLYLNFRSSLKNIFKCSRNPRASCFQTKVPNRYSLPPPSICISPYAYVILLNVPYRRYGKLNYTFYVKGAIVFLLF